MRPIKRIALYLRVSTQDQSTELQYGELLKYIEARGLPAPTIYQDKSTGTNGNRPAFKQLMTDIRLRKVDLVICWKLDRLFRSLKDLIATLQEYNELGVEFISLKDNIDMTTSAGRLMLHIIGAFGEFEASLIKERVRAGLANAKAHGRIGGRPTTNVIRLHDLRHTYASHFIMNGGTLVDLMGILGHSTPKMVLRYAHLAPGYLATKANTVSFSGEQNQADVISMADHR